MAPRGSFALTIQKHYLPRSAQWHVISMEFSNSLLRRYVERNLQQWSRKNSAVFSCFFNTNYSVLFFVFEHSNKEKHRKVIFVAVPCKLHNQCCIVWRFSKPLYLICYDRLVSLNDHVTPWSSILYPNTWLYNFETKAKEYRMWCIRDLCGKTLNVTQVSENNCKWFKLFVISRWNNKGNSWSPLWWAAQSWIGESLLTSLFKFFLISIRFNS